MKNIQVSLTLAMSPVAMATENAVMNHKNLAKKEGGACHYYFSKEFLTAFSWKILINNLGDHFGEDARLDEETRRRILTYMAAGRSMNMPLRATECGNCHCEETTLNLNWISHKMKLLLKTSLFAVFIMSAANIASAAERIDVKMPKELSAQAKWGRIAFDQNCAACHGDIGAGTEQGPPLIHDTYNPGHHGDESFYRAISSGVQQHHWPYGNMPAQSQIEPDLAGMIIKFIREVQSENGIVYKPHRM